MTKTRMRLGAALGGAALAATALVALPSPGQADTTVVLTTENHNARGWQGATTGDAATEMVTGPGTPPAGSGSLSMLMDSADDSVAVGTSSYGSLAPTDLTELAYGVYRFGDSNVSPSTTVAANLTISRRTLSVEQFVTTLVWEPTYAARPVRENRWESYSAVHSTAKGWWSTQNQGACGQSSTASCTFADAIATLPADAYISRIAFKAGSGWAGTFHAALDAIVIDTASADRTIFDWEPVVSPPPPTTQLDTRMTVNDVAFDEFKSGTYSGKVEADLNTHPTATNWQPLAGAYVEVFLDADGDADNGHEQIECAATSDANGVFSCSPPAELVPALFELDTEYVAVFGGGPGHKPAHAAGRATQPGPIREPMQTGEEASSTSTACALWQKVVDVIDPDTGEKTGEEVTEYWVCADTFDNDGDGTNDAAGVAVTRLGEDGYEKWSGLVDPSAVSLDTAGGTGSISATIDGVSDSSTGQTCTVSVSFTATGPAESFSGADHPMDIAPGDRSATVTTDRTYSGSDRPASATGSACGYAAVAAGTSVDGAMSDYHEDRSTVIING